MRLLLSCRVRAALAMVAALGFGASANAQLNDDPYFNLFSKSTTYGGGDFKVTGDGTNVWICGTDQCDGTRDSSAGYALFSVYTQQPAGSGYIDPFLRFAQNEPPGTPGSATTEAAYNTSNDILQDDANFTNQAKDTVAGGQTRDSFNHALVYSGLTKETINGIEYMTFLLDINETAKTCEDKRTDCEPGNTLRLEELEFFIAQIDDMDEYVPDHGVDGTVGGKFLDADANALKFWDMDFEKQVPTSGNAKQYGGLLLDSLSGSAGSGDFDVQVKIPVTASLQEYVNSFYKNELNKGKDLYVYLYNFAGEADPLCTSSTGDTSLQEQGCGEAEANFEEWAAVTSEPPTPPSGNVPVPATALLFTVGLLGMVRGRKR